MSFFRFDNNVNYPFGGGPPNNQNNQNNSNQRPRQRQSSRNQRPPRPNQSRQGNNPDVSQRQNQPNRERQESSQRPTYSNSKKRVRKSEEPNSNNASEKQTNQSQALLWKDKGNESFKNKKYEEAIQCYTKGISLSDSHSVLYSNRCRCYKLIGKYAQALKDIQIAIDLDDNNIKAYLMQGQLLAEQGKHQQTNNKVELAITKMKKALRLCASLNKPQFKDDTNIYLLRAQKLLWCKKYEQTQKYKAVAVQNYQKALQTIPNIKQQQYNNRLTEFLNLMVPPCDFIIPQNLCCKITYELMEDPVTTQSGHTYERKAIETHIRQNGRFDPFTRKPISDRLYPNLLAKALIDDFVSKNPWAYQYVEGQNCMQSYKGIKF